MLFCILSFVTSTILGIDLGDQNIRVSVISRNRSLHAGINQFSRKYTPNNFAFWNVNKVSDLSATEKWNISQLNDYDWAFGELAEHKCWKFPRLCLRGNHWNNGKVKFNLSGMEITALSLIKLVDSIKVAENIQDRIEAVVAINGEIQAHEKSFLYEAFNLAGIPVVQFIDMKYAPAFYYTLEKAKNETKNIAFVDIGASGSRISIYEINGDKNKTSMKQLSSQYNNFGGNYIDEKLALLLSRKYNVSINDERIKYRFIKEISEKKEKLGFYQSFEFKFDDDDDIEEKTVILSLEDLKEISGEFNNSIHKLIDSSLKQSGIKKIDNVEMIGGCSRILFIQENIKNDFNISRLNYTLDSENAVSFGAAYFAADRSHEYILKKIKSDVMINSPSILQTGNTIYKIFSNGDREDSNPAVLLTVHPNQIFYIKTGKENKPYMKFMIKNITKETNVEISFIHNYYLMPVPYSVINDNNETLELEYLNVGWEIPAELINHSNIIVQTLNNVYNNKRNLEKEASNFESYLLYLEKFLQTANIKETEKAIINKCINEGYEWFEEKSPKTIQDYITKKSKITKETEQIIQKWKEEVQKPMMIEELHQLIIKSKSILEEYTQIPDYNETKRNDFIKIISESENLIDKQDLTLEFVNEKITKLKDSLSLITNIIEKNKSKPENEKANTEL